MHLNVKVLLIHLPLPYAVNCVAHMWLCSYYFLNMPAPAISDLTVIVSDSGRLYWVNIFGTLLINMTLCVEHE